VTILRVGSNPRYAEGWDIAFGKKKSAAKSKKSATATKAKAKKKKAKK